MKVLLAVLVLPAVAMTIGEWLGSPSVAERVYVNEATEQCVNANRYAASWRTWDEDEVREDCRAYKLGWYRRQYGH